MFPNNSVSFDRTLFNGHKPISFFRFIDGCVSIDTYSCTDSHTHTVYEKWMRIKCTKEREKWIVMQWESESKVSEWLVLVCIGCWRLCSQVTDMFSNFPAVYLPPTANQSYDSLIAIRSTSQDPTGQRWRHRRLLPPQKRGTPNIVLCASFCFCLIWTQ